jgi:hypothetical protein
VPDTPSWPLVGDDAHLPDIVSHLAATIRGTQSHATLIDSPAGRIGLLYVVRTSRHLDAVAAVCRAGFAPEASSIVRSMWEDVVTLAHLAESPEDRAEKWMAFAEKRREAIVLSDGTRPGGRAWWAGRPSQIAGQLGDPYRQLGREFERYYWRLSDESHYSPWSATRYVVTDPGDELPPLLAGPSDSRVDEMSAVAAMAATRLCKVANDLGVDLDMDAIAESAMKAAAPYNKRREGPSASSDGSVIDSGP